jgi:hypothetical protein
MNDRSPPTTVEPDDPDEAEADADQLSPRSTLCHLTEFAPLGCAVVKHHDHPPHSCAHSHAHS